MKKMIVFLVSLVAITATAQVRTAVVAARKQVLSPRTLTYPAVRATQYYPWLTYSTVAVHRKPSTSQIRVAPVFIASNEAVLLPERSNFQKIIPVESCKSAMLLEDNKVNASKRKNAVNWALVIFVCGAVVLFSWGIIAIYRKFLGDENNHGELARYSQAAANHSCNIVLANGEGVLIKA